MQITGLKLTNFKNYQQETTLFSDGINLIYGDNGAGKTNLLDAIYLLSIGKSYFSLPDKSLIRDEDNFYRLEANYLDQAARKSKVVMKYQIDKRREVEVNEQKIKQVGDIVGKHPLVMVAPDDISVVYGGSKERRDFYNRILCQSNRSYLDALMKYNRLMRQKDALLKSRTTPDRLSVVAYNQQLIPLAQIIYDTRVASTKELNPMILDHYKTLSADKEVVSIKYISKFNDEEIPSVFDRLVEQEIMAKRPLVGIQRDDYLFEIGVKPLKKFGSQGQIKSFLYSLRMAEYYFLSKALDKKPILVLDDYFEKLDRHRLSHLLQLIHSDAFGQIFLTDTELNRSKDILEENDIAYKSFMVTDGGIATQTN